MTLAECAHDLRRRGHGRGIIVLRAGLLTATIAAGNSGKIGARR
jgi:hypothetical protein